MPQFSIVVPAYNASDTLAETLDAVVAQEYHDWECIVVDDGSIDETSRIAAEYARVDSRFRVIAQPNQGTAGAYNSGVQSAASDLIAICSSDDLLLPHHLARMHDTAQAYPKYDIYSSNGFYLAESGETRTVYTGSEWKNVRSLSFKEVLGCCFFSVGAVYRMRVFEDIGGYRTGVYGEDYDFWLRAMAAGYTHLYVPLELSVHRISSQQKSADLVRVLRSNVEAYSHLLDKDLVRNVDRIQVQAALEARITLISRVEFEIRSERRLRALQRYIAGITGANLAERITTSILKVIRKVGSWRR